MSSHINFDLPMPPNTSPCIDCRKSQRLLSLERKTMNTSPAAQVFGSNGEVFGRYINADIVATRDVMSTCSN
jgi:hypothetical protein